MCCSLKAVNVRSSSMQGLQPSAVFSAMSWLPRRGSLCEPRPCGWLCQPPGECHWGSGVERVVAS
jgi:hypothetical protein